MKVMSDPSQKPCLLVVDDDRNIREMLSVSLEKQFDVICYPNGEEIPEAVEAHEPVLILLDVNLPGMDGHEVCLKIRSHAKIRNIPILFITVLKDDKTFIDSLDAGGDSVITKPFEIAPLRRKISELIASREVGAP